MKGKNRASQLVSKCKLYIIVRKDGEIHQLTIYNAVMVEIGDNKNHYLGKIDLFYWVMIVIKVSNVLVKQFD